MHQGRTFLTGSVCIFWGEYKNPVKCGNGIIKPVNLQKRFCPVILGIEVCGINIYNIFKYQHRFFKFSDMEKCLGFFGKSIDILRSKFKDELKSLYRLIILFIFYECSPFLEEYFTVIRINFECLIIGTNCFLQSVG